MKKKLLFLLIAAFFSAVWLFPFRFDMHFPVFAAALFVCFALALLIPNPYISFAALSAVCVGVSIFDIRFLPGFVPAAMWIGACFVCLGRKTPQPLGKDGFFTTLVLLTGLFTAVSAAVSITSFAREELPELTVGRYLLWPALLAGAWIWLTVSAHKKAARSTGRAAAETRTFCRNLSLLCALQLGVLAAAALFALRQGPGAQAYFYPLLPCACAFAWGRKDPRAPACLGRAAGGDGK